MYAFGQEYRCIVPGEDRFYTDGAMLGLRIIDSETVPEGILHHFHHDLRPVAIGDPSGCNPDTECGDSNVDVVYYTTIGASWLGTSLLERPNGHNLFFNMNGDTITINTSAELGDSWTVFRWGDTARIEASVSAIATETVHGTSQLVKTLTLQAFDADGLAMAHPLNGTEWKLSQYDGLFQVHSLYWFPDFPAPESQEAYECVAQFYPDHEHYSDTLIKQIDQRPPTEGIMYDFEVGDEVQMREVATGWPEGVWYSLYTVIAKEFSGSNLTVTFSVQKINWVTQSVVNSTEVISSLDTSNIYPLNTLPGLGGHITTAAEVDTVYFPFGLMGGDTILTSLFETCQFDAVRLIEQYVDSTGPECAAYFPIVDGIWGSRFRISGIPATVSLLSTVFGDSEVIPVYVNTSTCQFGQRLIVGIDEHQQTLLLHPNPTSSLLRFTTEVNSPYSITDMLGRTVQRGMVQAGSNEVQVAALPDGIYLFRLEGPGSSARFVKTGQ